MKPTYSIRSLVYSPHSEGVPSQTTERLLRDMGHDVCSTTSSDQALRWLRDQPSDLLVVDGDPSDYPGTTDLLDALSPQDVPRQIAIFSSRLDDATRHLRHRISPDRVHVFLKPLHLHGLLGVLKHLEEPQKTGAVA